MNIDTLIRSIQKEVGVEVDGKAGPQTWEAIHKRIFRGKKKATAKRPRGLFEKVDARSEKNIATLLPKVQPYARALVYKAAAAGIKIKVISGTRTFEEQDKLYAQGRTKPGKKVTRARGGYSNHNFGLAFDIGVFEGKNYLGKSPKYKAVGALGLEVGLDWGGNWKSIKDEPHFQLRPKWATELSERQMLVELRKRTKAENNLLV